MNAGSDGLTAPHIVFEDVAKSFGTSQGATLAVRDVNFYVARGELVTVLGPSGCGKSTTLNMIAGLYQPSAGEVTYGGKPVRRINERVGYMTQQDHLLPWRTTASNIRLPLELVGASSQVREQTVARLIDLVGLRGFEDHYPDQLSGGMRRRCALARLFAYDPETLLMDEPFAALDAQMRLDLQQELRALASSSGKTVVFVTHDIDEAILLGDRCLVFGRSPGTIVAELDVDLGDERDLRTARFEPKYQRVAEQLWLHLAPQVGAA